MLLLVTLSNFCLQTKAQTQGTQTIYTINPDGSVSPQTALIKRTGYTYSLTGDLGSDSIVVVETSNIILNGNQHKLSGIQLTSVKNVTLNNLVISISSEIYGISVGNSSNISIKSCTITGNGGSMLYQTDGVFISYSSSTIISENSIEGSSCAIDLLGCQNDIVDGNVLSAVPTLTWGNLTGVIMVGLVYEEGNNSNTTFIADSSSILVYNNTFLSTRAIVSQGSSVSWDNGKIGNYWADYLTRYPNATEIDNSGIGNTPYVINENNIDYYPLMNVSLAVPTLGVTAIIPVGERPEGITYDSGLNEVFVANYGSNSVSVISDHSNAVIATVSVGDEPAGVVYDSNKSEIFVANDGSGTVSVISCHKDAVIATITVGANPVDLAYDYHKGEVFVTNWGSNTISVISDNNNTVVATIPTGTNFIGQFPPSGPAYPIGVVCDSVKGLIYVVNSYSDSSWVGTVSVISDSNNTVLESIPVGVDPYYAVFDSGMGEIFVTNDASDFLSVISDSTNTVVANVTLPEGSSSMGITYDSTHGALFAVNEGGTVVFVLSDSTNSVVESVPLSNATFSFGETDCIAYDAGTGEIFVTNSGDSAVLALAYKTGISVSSTPTIPELSLLAIIPLMVSVHIVAVVLRHRKTANQNR